MSVTDYVYKSSTAFNFGTWIFKANYNPYIMDFGYDVTLAQYVKASNQKVTFGYTYETNLYPFIFGVLARKYLCDLREEIMYFLSYSNWFVHNAGKYRISTY
jgi:hypothetical protein